MGGGPGPPRCCSATLRLVVFSGRVQTAIESRSNSTNDFYGGWDEADLDFLARWAPDPATLQPVRGLLVDWLDVRTELSNHAWLTVPKDGSIVVSDLPVPDDQVHAEAIEYVGMLRSIERAQGMGSTYTMMELGSSYGPWSVAAGVVARRAGFERIAITAVEASAATIPLLERHIALNELGDDPRLSWRVIHAAVSATSGVLHFPRVDTRLDNGAQVTATPHDVDYRGLAVTYDAVQAVTLRQLVEPYDRVDFVHLDLQGAEEALLTDDDFLSTATDRVSAMLLATQSRLIEGLALRELSRRGWRLLRERPTRFEPNERTADVNGWTTRDGAQFWVNGAYG